MMVLWEYKEMNVKELGNFLFLDSGTLTPLLKKLESKNYIQRQRMEKDERSVLIKITEEGEKLKEQALSVPAKMATCVSLDPQDAQMLYTLLHKVLAAFQQESQENALPSNN